MKKSKNILNYSQPEFYKFSRDSIELADLAARYEDGNKSIKVLELFAGSGVVGIEFESRHQSVEHITFVELQENFKAHIEDNIKNLDCRSEVLFMSFQSFQSDHKYDVILLNPPYFDSQKSRIGSNEHRNFCRFTLNFEFQDIVNKIEETLSANGSAYICHCDDLEKIDHRITKIGDYQGVGLFRFRLNIDRA